MNQSQNCLHGRSPMMRKLRLVSALTLKHLWLWPHRRRPRLHPRQNPT